MPGTISCSRHARDFGPQHGGTIVNSVHETTARACFQDHEGRGASSHASGFQRPRREPVRATPPPTNPYARSIRDVLDGQLEFDAVLDFKCATPTASGPECRDRSRAPPPPGRLDRRGEGHRARCADRCFAGEDLQAESERRPLRPLGKALASHRPGHAALTAARRRDLLSSLYRSRPLRVVGLPIKPLFITRRYCSCHVTLTLKGFAGRSDDRRRGRRERRPLRTPSRKIRVRAGKSSARSDRCRVRQGLHTISRESRNGDPALVLFLVALASVKGLRSCC